MSKDSYQVIARRWRPKQFSELVGQDHVVRTLGNAINYDCSRLFICRSPWNRKDISCPIICKIAELENGPSLEVPEDSEIGQSIMDGRCLDVIEIDGASNNSVEQVRDLRDECQYAPSQCRYKIYVIDEVHMLSQQAFNALLKTLEEPPPHVKFVFATTESHKVLPTIVSRCQIWIPFDSCTFDCGKISGIVRLKTLKSKKMPCMQSHAWQWEECEMPKVFWIKWFPLWEVDQQADVLEVYGLASSEQISNLETSVLSGDYDLILKITDEFHKMHFTGLTGPVRALSFPPGPFLNSSDQPVSRANC